MNKDSNSIFYENDFSENLFTGSEQKNNVLQYAKSDAKDKTCALSAVLKMVFGYDEFKNSQKEIIEELFKGNDVLAVMPTGGGKSICYQIPALLFKGLTIVVSPLIALMRDQLRELEQLGIPSAALNSSIKRNEYSEIIHNIRNGKVKLLYVAPETLVTNRIKNLISLVEVDCFAVDEAHCISEWGHDFRPEYRQLAEIRTLIPNAVCLALTATATEQIRLDIKKNLKLFNCKEFVASFNRKNIYLEVKSKHRPFKQLKEFLEMHKGESGIIYCLSRKQADTLAEKLYASGYIAHAYHAGLSAEERNAVQEDFINDKLQIITATVAFGMGINKPNVRFVVHFDLPKTLEQYYQEIGRAGRDGEQAYALLLFSGADIFKMKFFLKKNGMPDEKIEKMISTISSYAYCESCRRQYLLSYFGEILKQEEVSLKQRKNPCCDICLSLENNEKEISTPNQSGTRKNQNGKFDTTIPAQKIMSCILRTGSLFGVNYIADVLSGSKRKRVLENGHDKLSVWGIGTELSKHDWIRLTEILTSTGFLIKDEKYRSLSLSPLGKEKLKNREPIIIPFEKNSSEKENKLNKTRYFYAEVSEKELTKEQADIAEALKKMRRTIAEKNGVPSFMIFPDKTLLQLAVKQPNCTEELDDIFGIGKVKKERYGDIIIKTIKNKIEN